METGGRLVRRQDCFHDLPDRMRAASAFSERPGLSGVADGEHRILGREKALYTELTAILAGAIVPGLGLDAEALRAEADVDQRRAQAADGHTAVCKLV